MRNITLKQWVWAALFLLTPWVADAAGLGRLIVLSSLGQPLNAEIDLVSVRNDELSTLSARLATPEMYKQANLQYGPALIGLRLSIEKRANGQPYVKLASTRPVQEPFIDLLIELNWATGRIVREYTALLDPPGFGSAAAELAPPAVTARPAPAPAPAVAAAPVKPAAPAAVSPATGAREYGPIKRGETLGKIAAGLKPEGVTLEQMLVGLYRSNPDAFINKNLNLVKSGRILRVPEREELAALPQQEAVREYRTQVADWNAYRRQLAEAAPAVPESRSAASGRITPRVEDKAAGADVKDVVRLSKGEPPGAAGSGKAATADRVRTLEEEVVAREKALKEANERIAQLEKTISDQKRLIELKSAGMAAAQQQAKPEAPKPEAAPKPAADAAKPEAQAAAPADKPAAEAKPEAAKPAPEPKPQPKAKPQTPPPPPPEPGLVDTIMGEPLYLLAGGGAVVLAGLGFWLRRRRSAPPAADGGPGVKADPSLSVAAAAPAAAAVAATAAPAELDEVDPLAEAEVYIAYGRDGQAEEILKEALARHPDQQNLQLKLLEIYAARKDKAAFGGIAAGLSKLTGGQGENWLRAAAMGYALDPENPLYAAGKDVPATADLDFNLDAGSGSGATTTDILLDAAAVQQAAAEDTVVMPPGAMQAMTEAANPPVDAAPAAADPELDVPPAGSVTQTDIDLDLDKPADDNSIDFSIELPKVDVPPAAPAGQAQTQAKPQDDGQGLDFKLDLPDINLDLDDKSASAAAPAASQARDAHWYDVQTKFDLAKAYQEMGEKDDAKAILREVIQEGDAEQQAEAKALLDKLS